MNAAKAHKKTDLKWKRAFTNRFSKKSELSFYSMLTDKEKSSKWR